jgi:hypothetical protein
VFSALAWGVISAVVIVVVLTGVIIRRVAANHIGFSTATVTDARLVSHKCGDCSGGVQVLNDGRWGPFTRGQLALSDDSPYFESLSANSRSCKTCVGKGFLWEDVPVNHGYRPPNMGYIEGTRRLIRWPWY